MILVMTMVSLLNGHPLDPWLIIEMIENWKKITKLVRNGWNEIQDL